MIRLVFYLGLVWISVDYAYIIVSLSLVIC